MNRRADRLQCDDDRSDADSSRAVDSREPGAAAGPAKVVLVIDDSEAFRTFLVRAIEMLGYAAVECDEAALGLDLYDSRRPDTVIVDWHLRGETSAELVHDLIARKARVVVMTGDSGAVGEIDAPVLDKPIPIAKLREVLEHT